MKAVKHSGGNYYGYFVGATSVCAPYGRTPEDEPVPEEPGWRLLDDGEVILKGDQPYDIYAGWIKSDGYHAKNKHHARSSGRWTAWRRKIK